MENQLGLDLNVIQLESSEWFACETTAAGETTYKLLHNSGFEGPKARRSEFSQKNWKDV